MALVVLFVTESSPLFVQRKDLIAVEVFIDKDFSEEAVLGGVGRPYLLIKLSGVNDNGLRFRRAGRVREGVGLVTATVGVTGVTGSISSFV
jgi:hypothetical protein